VHWLTGLGWGALYGILAGSTARPRIRWGLAYGSVVWLTSYVLLPAAKLYKPLWEYDAATLGKDFSAHLVYGAGTAAAFAALAGREKKPQRLGASHRRCAESAQREPPAHRRTRLGYGTVGI
jgi:uncharacterized membrane protein YagU involved in acid resistance